MIKENEEMSKELQTVLREFEDIFQKPKQLTLHRKQDHKITLVEGAQPINIMLYRYGSLQKDVIENMT